MNFVADETKKRSKILFRTLSRLNGGKNCVPIFEITPAAARSIFFVPIYLEPKLELKQNRRKN